MKKVALALVFFFFFCALCLGEYGFAEIIWQDISRGKLRITAVLVDPDNPNIVYIGAPGGVFKAEGVSMGWRNILPAGRQNKAINFISYDPQDKDSLYSGGNGLFYSADSGRNWRRIFKGRDYLSNEVTSLMFSPQGIYLGTKSGLFFSPDRGRHWHKESGVLGKSGILAIAYEAGAPGYIYIACVDGVFKGQGKGQRWERIFTALSTEDDSEPVENSEDLDTQLLSSNIRHIVFAPDGASLYLATSAGVYESRDKGLTFSLLTDYGLLSREVNFLAFSSKSNLYAVTKSGIFEYTGERWQEISFGLPASGISFLALDNQDNLYAACGKGLFKGEMKAFVENKNIPSSGLYFKNEPAIGDVQQAAIRYAEVDPEKIIRWRAQAGKKAWLPQLSAGVNRETSDLWHWEGGSTTKNDDDILKRGRDSIEWDVTLSWDLGEIIWNDDQTSIDARSRLMAQLRGDILDEVNKLYFERLRVKIELDSLSIEERKKRLEKELRLQELTASLDGLTGGYFSRSLKSLTS